jgi:hypothetical protein
MAGVEMKCNQKTCGDSVALKAQSFIPRTGFFSLPEVPSEKKWGVVGVAISEECRNFFSD